MIQSSRLIQSPRTWSNVLAAALVATFAQTAMAQDKPDADKPFKPYSGQPGRDVVWVPTPEALVEKMLDMAKVTSKDIVMDLGSGDGRNVIAAAKRGATATGVEFNPKMVELSRASAKEAGVSDKATFIQGDMYQADISKASVLALFLLTTNLDKLTPKFLDMEPGSRIVVNGFRPSGWEPDATDRVENDCRTWCTAYLYYVPAKVEGTWQLSGPAKGAMTIDQTFQMFKGELDGATDKPVPVTEGKLKGREISFTIGETQYTGRVEGDAMKGEAGGKSWTATRK